MEGGFDFAGGGGRLWGSLGFRVFRVSGSGFQESHMAIRRSVFVVVAVALLALGVVASPALSQDSDGDGHPDATDNCPQVANPSQADCDSDGVGDACEQSTADCNGNGIPDSCDLSSGASADCNQNGTPDECEDGSVWRSTGNMGGFWNTPNPTPASGALPNMQAAASDVTITIRAVADLDATNEFVYLYCGSQDKPIATLFAAGSPACGELNTASITMSAADWNALVASYGPTIPITLEPSFAVGQVCDGSSTGSFVGFSEVIVTYTNTSHDCNGNGLSDLCETASGQAADCDANTVPDSCQGDADGDGSIDECDGCPTDPAKIDPGVCGCGVADTDSDGDGILDCLRSGEVVCWGYLANFGTLAPPVDLGPCRKVAAGSYHALAITEAGSVRAWGSQDYGQSEVPRDLDSCVQVAGGEEHSIALTLPGMVRAWGGNSVGQTSVPKDLGPCMMIASGSFHSIAITQAGTVRAWGSNGGGQSTIPSDLGPCTQIAGGYYHTIALTEAGSVRAWGFNHAGQTTVPTDLGPCMEIAAGAVHSVAITQSGSVRAWGHNYHGQCSVPESLGPCTQIAGGESHTVALTTTGLVRAWGLGGYGQTTAPVDLGPCIQIAAARFDTIAIRPHDCDANGIPDVTEMAGNDCNGNSVHDACEITVGLLEDCNDNGFADTCEKSQSLNFSSAELGPIGAGSPQVWSIPNAARASTDVRLHVSALGDFDSPFETLTVKLDTVYNQIVLGNTGAGTQCSEREGTLIVPMDLFNGAMSADGTLVLRFEGSIAVDPNACPQDSWIQATLEYTSSTTADCNSNGLLDTCEIAKGLGSDANRNGMLDECEIPILTCPGDFNLNNTVDGLDMGILLAAWGSTNQPDIDLNDDGVVSGADLTILLVAWGPCQEN